MSSDDRVVVVEYLRGIAALGVCWFHFTYANPTLRNAEWVKASGAIGFYGVHIFFVVSGFALASSMSSVGYQLRHFFRFIARRIVRLDPAYFASIALVILLWWASAQSPGYAGPGFVVDRTQVALHAGYLNDLAGVPWLNVVYWTLALEFQFYLLMALVFPVLFRGSAMFKSIALVMLAFASLLFPAQNLVFHWLGLFASGIAVFFFLTGMIERWQFFFTLMIVTCVTTIALGIKIAAVSAVTALFIAFTSGYRGHLPPLAFLGAISYSLYLLHVPIGGRVVNLATRFFAGEVPSVLIAISALGISIVAAWILYVTVERPSIRLSRRITLGGRRATVQASVGAHS